MHERLAPEDSEKYVPVCLRVADRPVQRFEIDLCPFRFHIHPATLAPQIARVDNREIQERRKILPALDAALESFDRYQPLHAEIPRKLPDASEVRSAQRAHDQCG